MTTTNVADAICTDINVFISGKKNSVTSDFLRQIINLANLTTPLTKRNRMPLITMPNHTLPRPAASPARNASLTQNLGSVQTVNHISIQTRPMTLRQTLQQLPALLGINMKTKKSLTLLN
jgi:hypothetical protein